MTTASVSPQPQYDHTHGNDPGRRLPGGTVLPGLLLTGVFLPLLLQLLRALLILSHAPGFFLLLPRFLFLLMLLHASRHVLKAVAEFAPTCSRAGAHVVLGATLEAGLLVASAAGVSQLGLSAWVVPQPFLDSHLHTRPEDSGQWVRTLNYESRWKRRLKARQKWLQNYFSCFCWCQNRGLQWHSN